MPERYDNHHAIVTSHPYRQLFRHNIKYPAKRYDRHEIYNERRDGTLVRVFDGKACRYGGLRRIPIHDDSSMTLTWPQSV